MEFVACETCSQEPGETTAPPLCNGCVNNRNIIEELMSQKKEAINMEEVLKVKRGREYKYISHDNNSNILLCSKTKASKTIYYQMDIVYDSDGDLYFINNSILKTEGKFPSKFFNEIASFLAKQYQCVCDLEAYNGIHSNHCKWYRNHELIKEFEYEYKDFIKE